VKHAIRLLVLAALVAGGVYAWREYRAPKPVAVVLAAVERGRVESTIANTRAGTVKACRRSRLSPQSGGQVARLEVREGDRVQTGQVLVVLWNVDLQARLTLANSEQRAAVARSKETCLNAQHLAREARRLERLAEQKVISEDQLDRAVTQAQVSEAACRAAGAANAVAQAQVDAARAALERSFLEAPFPGVVAEVNAEVGEYVTPSPPGIPTPPAVDLIDDSCAYVSAPIDEVDAPAVRVGMTACVSLDAFPERRCNGKVRRIAPYVLDREKQARTVEVEVDLGRKEDEAGLLPGYSADVEIVVEAHDAVLRVPTEAVLEGQRVLVVADPDGTIEERSFQPGLANWRHTEVRSGLAEGERIVLSVDREGAVPGARVVAETVSSPAATP
jgi:HlyD family secretion protein